jgi:hypothetical protein
MNNNAFNKDLDQRFLNIREDKISGVYVEGLTDFIVENVYDCVSILKKGESNRKKRQTTKNEMSSRSHTLLMLTFDDNKINKNGTIKVRTIINTLNRNQNYAYVIWPVVKSMTKTIRTNRNISAR